LARLLGENGQRTAALVPLAAIYADFSEGFETCDLRDAKALLDQLA
jgi:hypothetical protein